MKAQLIIILLFAFLTSNGQKPFSWPLDSLDTARDVPYLSEAEKDVILETNKLRFNPAKFAEMQMEWMKAYYKGKFLEIPGKKVYLTNEGIKAFDECISALKQKQSLPLLQPSKGMSRACDLLVYDQSTTGETGHKGSGNTSPADRVNRFGTFYGHLGENIQYGDTEPRFIVISLLIDDGVKSRGHRNTLLDPNFNVIGVSIGKHKVYEGMCVCTYASKYQEN